MSKRKRLLWVRLVRLASVLATLLALLVAVLLLGRQVLFQGPYRPPTALPGRVVVDVHTHLAGIGAGDSGCFISPALRSNFRFRIYLDAFGATEAELREQGDALILRRISDQVGQSRHVAAAVVLALDGVVDAGGHLDTNRTEVYIPNDFVAREVARHTNLLFCASINPHRADALERLDRAVADGAVLLKWIPSIMQIDPADSAFIPFYRRLQQHHLPLLTHTGVERSFTTAEDSLADPERLRLPLEQGVVVIAAHVGAPGPDGGDRNFDTLRRLMREFPNLHADISALTQVNRLGRLREALAAPEFQGRLVYGSDFPLINTALVSPWFFPLNLTERQRSEIAALDNPWDRDVALKQALGVPPEIFTRGRELLRLPAAPAVPNAPPSQSSSPQ